MTHQQSASKVTRPASPGRARAAATAAGALVVALTASPAASATPPAVKAPSILLTTGSTSPFQALLDQIVAGQNTVIATNSQYPFVTDFDKTLLPGYAQMSAMNQLVLGLSQYNLDHSYSQNSTSVIPYQWNAPGAEPYNFLNSPNPDEQYHLLPVGDKTEVVTVHPGPGTEEVTFTMMTGNGMTKETDWHSVTAFNLSEFHANPDGSYTIYVGPDAPTGANWIDTDGYGSVLIRDTLGDWGLPHTASRSRWRTSPRSRCRCSPMTTSPRCWARPATTWWTTTPASPCWACSTSSTPSRWIR